jgi:two-component system, cell cycle response regulator CpdR
MSGSGTTVLLVDDEQTDLIVIRCVLEGAGYSVVCASSYNQATELFEMQPQGFDLLLSDISMPGKSGLELAKALLRKKPDLKILLMSAWVGAQLLEAHGIALPERHFLAKPFRSAALLKQVDQVMRNQDSAQWLLGQGQHNDKHQPNKQ